MHLFTTGLWSPLTTFLYQHINLQHLQTHTDNISRCCTARLERPACWHRFCTVTGHFQAALEDSSVWTIIRLTTDLVICPWSFAYGRINTVVNNNNNNISPGMNICPSGPCLHWSMVAAAASSLPRATVCKPCSSTSSCDSSWNVVVSPSESHHITLHHQSLF